MLAQTAKDQTHGVEIGTILPSLTMPVWIFDVDRSRIIWANDSGLSMWKAETLEELQARDLSIGMSTTVATRLRQYQRDFIETKKVFQEVWTHYPKEIPSTIRVNYSGIVLNDGRTAMLCEGGGEVDETPEKLRSVEALTHTSVMISLHTQAGSMLWSNPAASAAISSDADFGDHLVDPADRTRLRTQLEADGSANLTAEVRTASGKSWHEITVRYCRDPVTGNQACLSSEVDVSDIKQTEAQARYDAWHDPLTGLPNRNFVMTMFQEKLTTFLSRSRSAALLFVDLDRFKVINDSLGHRSGDEVLIEVAKRLSAAVGNRGQVARLGGDEFLVLIEVAQPNTLDDTVTRILNIVQRPLTVAGHRLQLNLSIGVSIAPDDGTDITTLMTNSDAAMYRAKHSGGNRRNYFTPEICRDAMTRMQMEIDLRSEFEQGLLQLHYQPRVATATGRIVSAEALLRWPRATGMVPPDAFIPIAEESGLIGPIGAWVLRQAASQQVAWKRAGYSVKLSVNVSPRQLSDCDFLNVAQAVIAETKCDPHDLELEITERLLLDDRPDTTALLRDLRHMGFGISVDDFGVGYSNLAALHRHPIDCLKIDRSFIKDLDEQGALTEMIINMGRLLKLRVVAEGVETERQLTWLRERRCDEYQGFLFSKAVPSDAFWALLQNAATEALSVSGSKHKSARSKLRGLDTVSRCTTKPRKAAIAHRLEGDCRLEPSVGD